MKNGSLESRAKLDAALPEGQRRRGSQRPAVAYGGHRYGWSSEFQTAFDQLVAAHGAPCTG